MRTDASVASEMFQPRLERKVKLVPWCPIHSATPVQVAQRVLRAHARGPHTGPCNLRDCLREISYQQASLSQEAASLKSWAGRGLNTEEGVGVRWGHVTWSWFGLMWLRRHKTFQARGLSMQGQA